MKDEKAEGLNSVSYRGIESVNGNMWQWAPVSIREKKDISKIKRGILKIKRAVMRFFGWVKK